MDQNIVERFGARSSANVGHAVAETRELAPERFWAGQIDFPPGLSAIDAISAIETAAKKLDLTLSGFLQEESGSIQFEMTRYPRRAFGPVASVEEYEMRLQLLTAEFISQGIAVTGRERPHDPDERFRVVLGLEEGYLENQKRTFAASISSSESTFEDLKAQALHLLASAGAEETIVEKVSAASQKDELIESMNSISLARVHTISEIEKITQRAFSAMPVEIVAAGPWGRYSEPGALLEGAPEFLNDAKIIADLFRQARIAVELIGPDGGAAHMVEFPRWCNDPDKE